MSGTKTTRHRMIIDTYDYKGGLLVKGTACFQIGLSNLGITFLQTIL